ncbi:MAG TPA: class I SAM-dependent methyltransferase [Noviherbaspirillum sp.]|nr:class I SAM-dependent methyltransferase [Noviherbaspirillum sp.]
MNDDLWLDNWKTLITQRSASPAILELGCGSGRDTRWLAAHGFADITATEIATEALAECARAVPSAHLICHDLREPLPFTDGRFDVVLASLCLHYFAWDKTVDIVDEIRRCLAPDGLLLCRMNSTKDVNYGAVGHWEIAPNYYEVDGWPKRFFDAPSVDALFGAGWEQISKRELTIDRYEKPKVVWEVVLRRQ